MVDCFLPLGGHPSLHPHRKADGVFRRRPNKNSIGVESDAIMQKLLLLRVGKRDFSARGYFIPIGQLADRDFREYFQTKPRHNRGWKG